MPGLSPKNKGALLPLSAVADHWQCSVRHVRRLVQAGALPAVDIGHGQSKVWRVTEWDMAQFETVHTLSSVRSA